MIATRLPRRSVMFSVTAIAMCVFVSSARGQADEQQAKQDSPPLTVAVLDFEAKMPGNEKLGSQIGDTLTALLAGESNLRLVERPKLRMLLEEQELSLTGMVSAEDAVKLGNLVGARIIVTGRLFPLGSKLYLTSKVIGTETSLVEGVLVKTDADQDMDDLVTKLAVELAEKLRKTGPKLVAAADADEDPVPALIAALKGRTKPTLAVRITEQHHSRNGHARAPIDPAVQTEVTRLLTEAGFTVVDPEQTEAIDRWIKAPDRIAWPNALQQVDRIVTGEAMSEYSARLGNLVSCAGRAELSLLDRQTGQVQLADRTTRRAVDLSENIAAKAALQKAGRELGIKLLKHFDEHLPEAAEHQVILRLNPERLAAMDLTARQVIAAVRDRNPGLKVTAMDKTGDQLRLNVSGTAERLGQLHQTIVSLPDGPLVKLADLAEIHKIETERGK